MLLLTLSLLGFPVTRLLLCLAVAMASHPSPSSSNFHLLLHNVSNQVLQAKPLLVKTVNNILKMANQNNLKSVAIPALSSGLFNFPVEKCADIIVETLRIHNECAYPGSYPCDIRLVNHDDPTVKEMERACRKIFSGTDVPVGKTLRSHTSSATTPSTPLVIQMGNVRLTLRFDEQNTSGPELILSSSCAETNEEAKGWLENLFHCSGMATVNNNFIQYLGVEELQKLNGDAEPNTSIEEFFERGCAKIKIQAESPENAIVHVLKAEAMLCAVQKEFAREVKAHVPMPSAGVPVDVDKGKLRDFERLGLRVKKILKVDHPALMEAFELKKKQMGSSAPPRLMYQRIPAQFCSMLTSIGFQREYAPPDDPKYGEGIYFAGSLSSAVDLWREQSHQDVYQYYVLAQVLTGKSTTGKRDLIMPPPVGSDPLVLYDSLVGGNDISVVFNGHQALPQYIFICQKVVI
ncbi:unnamed protein product [Merluccius merluccius]